MHNIAGARALIDAGLRAHQAGHLASAIASYRAALAIAPDDPAGHHLLGTALVHNGQAADGIAHLERAAARQRNNAGILGNLAQAYFDVGRYADARDAFRKASRAEPRQPRYQLGIANSWAMEGNFAEAESLLKRVVQRFPGEPLAWFNYGNVLRDLGRIDEAMPQFAQAVERAPQFVEARNNLAGALHNLQRFTEAEAQFRTCMEQAPDYLLARCNLASVLIDLGRFAEAEALCRDVIRADPTMVLAHTYLGATLGHMGRLVAALQCHAAVAATEHSAPVVQAYAGALADVGRYAESMRWFCRALTYDPQSTAAHQVLGTAQLKRGCLQDGWKQYAWRPARQSLLRQHPSLGLTDELPDALEGKHVCVLGEQGLGDEIYFLRWTGALKARGARVTYRSSPKIRSLLARVTTIDHVLADDEDLPSADHYLLVGDLPRAFSRLPESELPLRTEAAYSPCVKDLPERIAAYWPPVVATVQLTPLGERVAELRDRLAAAGPGPYIGVTWRAGTPPEKQHEASWVLFKECPMEGLASAVAQYPGTVIALQRKPAPGEIDALAARIGRPVHDFTPYNEDLEGMLALLAVIDEYVGVSNTNMHLRAGVGRTARVLVPCPPEWRWMHIGTRSPWFPDFRVYRQSLQGDWTAALQALAGDLREARA